MLLEEITPLLITFNEELNIGRVLEQLRWARRIVIIDSGSTDCTLEIVRRYPQTEVLTRTFDSFAEQCNFGLAQIRSNWVLSLDADYELSNELVRELSELRVPRAVAGFQAHFTYRVYGRSLRGTLYPPRTVLYRVNGAAYANEGHGHRVSVAGQVRSLRGVIYHDDRKPLARWLASQQRYAHVEAHHLLSADRRALSRTDRIRKLGWPAPILVLFYVLLVKGCLADGWPGWFYALQRVLAETIIALELVNHRLLDRMADQAHTARRSW